MTAKQKSIAEARTRLLADPYSIRPGQTLYTVLRHVSRSGMMRSISVCMPIIRDGVPEVLDLSGLVAQALGEPYDRDRGRVKVGGCGMDMGFHLVYNLSFVLFPEGFGCIGKGPERDSSCPSCDHNNGDRIYVPHSPDQSTVGAIYHWHKDGGYALRHAWI